MSTAPIDYAQAGELKFGQVGIANLRIRTLDSTQLAAEMRDRVQRAPNLFSRAAVILDFGALMQPPSVEEATALINALRDAGVIPVALAYGTKETEALAQQLAMPILAKFRSQYEGASGHSTAVAPAPTPEPAPEPPPTRETPAQAQLGLMHTAPVRSGQQVYAEHRDLTILNTVGAGAEVLADGNIHIYGALRGRALAGAQGNPHARIFCREFHAELVAIAGNYKVMEDIPNELRGQSVQIWLDNGQLKFAAFD
jgi:septum site-determining protein MinC